MNSNNVLNRKLTGEESVSLEGEITLKELYVSLKKSKMSSASGWDRVSYYMLLKYWKFVGPLLTLSARETFQGGELGKKFRTGLIKIIPKKGVAERIGDWRLGIK